MRQNAPAATTTAAAARIQAGTLHRSAGLRAVLILRPYTIRDYTECRAGARRSQGAELAGGYSARTVSDGRSASKMRSSRIIAKGIFFENCTPPPSNPE